jgi:hypothetical protein
MVDRVHPLVAERVGKEAGLPHKDQPRLQRASEEAGLLGGHGKIRCPRLQRDVAMWHSGARVGELEPKLYSLGVGG